MPDQKQSILLGALVTALLGLLLAFFSQGGGQMSAVVAGIATCCLAPIAGSMMAVWHFTDIYELTLGTGEGARLGAISAALGSILSSALTYLFRVLGVFPGPEEQVELMRDQMFEQGMTEEQVEQALEMSQNFMSPLAQIGFVIAAIFLFALVGALGGAIGSAMFKKGGDMPSVPRNI